MKKKATTKKSKKIPIGYRIIAIILLLCSILFLGSIIYLNILNWIYLLLVIGIIFLLDGVSLLMMFRGKKKSGLTISTILILLFSILSFYIIKTTDFLTNLNLDYKTYNYSVVVLKNSEYKKIKDLDGLNLGYYDEDSEEGEKALEKVTNKTEVERTPYEDTHELANALLNNEVEAILLENSYLDILSESIVEEDKTFNEMIREIYSFVIVVKTSDISKDLNVTKEPFSIYVSGIDTYGEISSVSRSDVNMVVTVNPSTRQILLTSIPRDYYVSLHGKSGYKDKLTHAGMYGIDTSIQTIEDLLDIEINYYVKVNFSSVINIVDAIGGVTVYSDYTFTSIDNYSYQEGYNKVNGEEALSFARERKAFATGDRQRVKNQQALLKAIFDKCTSKSIITKYTKLLDSLNGSFVTNMKMSRLTSLIRMQLSKNYSWNIVTNSLEGDDASNYTYSAPSQKVYVMTPDEESVLYASELINKIIEGEILDEEVMENVSNEVHTVIKNNTNTNNSSTNNTDSDSSTTKENSNNKNTEGLKAKLNRSEVNLVEGDEYIYHGYTATYNGEDITNNSTLTEKFDINNQTFSNYKDLISYITNKLSSGKYTITYTIQYKDESVILKQSVTIEPLETTNENEPNTDDNDITSLEPTLDDNKPNNNIEEDTELE